MSMVHEHRLSTMYQIKVKSDEIASRSVTKQLPSIREGLLLKKRDHMKGWRSRHFVLDALNFYYYLPEDMTDSRNFMTISGAEIVTQRPIASSTHFQITITDAKKANEWVVSTESESDFDDWVNALTKASSNGIEGITNEKFQGSNKANVRNTIKHLDSKVVYNFAVPNIVPENIMKSTKELYNKMIEHSESNLQEWTFLFQQEDVKAYRKPGVGTGLIRGELVLQYTIPQIFDILTTPSKFLVMYPDVEEYKVLSYYTHNHGVEYNLAKTTWPAQARDFCNIFYWDLFNSNRSLCIFSYSDIVNDICPQVDKYMRANLIHGGYVLKQTPEGTLTTIVSHVRTQCCMCGLLHLTDPCLYQQVLTCLCLLYITLNAF